MISKDVFSWVVSLQSSATALRECRHCGYSVEDDADECPICGSQEIATYDLE